MLNFVQSTLKNVVLYENAVFKFRKGLTLVRGINNNAPSGTQTNGAGKSLLVSPVATLVNRRPPISRGSEKGAYLGDKDSVVELIINKDQTNYALRQTPKGKASADLAIFKDGKNMEFRTTKLAEQFTDNLIGLNEDQFYTTVYLDGRRSSLLQFGSANTRFNFFTDLFQLADYDSVKTALKRKNLEIREAKNKLSILKEQADKVKADLEKPQCMWNEQEEERYFQVKAEHGILQEKATKLMRGISNAIRTETIHNQRQKLLDRISKLRHDIGDYTDDDLRHLRSILAEYTKWVAARDEHIRQEKEIKAERDALYIPPELVMTEARLNMEIRTLMKYMGNAAALLKKLEPIKIKAQELSVERARIIARKEEFPNPTKQDPDVISEQMDIEPLPEDLKNEYDIRLKLHKLAAETGTCPICRAVVPQDEGIIKLRIFENGHIPLDKSDRVQALNLHIRRCIIEMKELRTTYGYENMEAYQIKESFDTMREQMDKFEAQRTSYVKHEILTTKLNKLIASRPKKPDIDTRGLTRTQVLELIDKRNALQRVKNELKIFDRTNTKQLEQYIHGRVVKLQKIYNRLQVSLAEKGKLHMELDSHRAVNRQLRRRLNSLRKDARPFIYTIKSEGFVGEMSGSLSNKGVKLDHIQHMAGLLNNELNRNAATLFAETTVFDISVAENQFDITYTRGHRKADVSKLSGAESRSFQMLLALSLINILPDSLRTDTIILDEMESNMSQASRELFITQFLPVLQKSVSKVVVVTPDSGTNFNEDHVVTAIKDGQKSTIKVKKINKVINMKKAA